MVAERHAGVGEDVVRVLVVLRDLINMRGPAAWVVPNRVAKVPDRLAGEADRYATTF